MYAQLHLAQVYPVAFHHKTLLRLLQVHWSCELRPAQVARVVSFIHVVTVLVVVR